MNRGSDLKAAIWISDPEITGQIYSYCRVFFLLIAILAAFGCAHKRYYQEANDAFSRGDYDRASFMSVEALREKPDFAEALDLLRTAVPRAFEQHGSRAKSNEERQDFDGAVAEYRKIENLAGAVSSVRSDIDLPDVSVQKRVVSLSAAESHYLTGLELLKEGEAASGSGRFKQAAVEFRKAQEFVPDYKDSKALYERARHEAVIRVAVLPFWDAGYGAQGRILADHVIARAMGRNPEFLEFVTREHFYQIEKEIGQTVIFDSKKSVEMGKVLGVQYIVIGRVLSAIVDGPERTDSRGSDSCSIWEKKDQYRTGTVSWVTHELKASAVVNASFQIIGVETGQIVAADTVGMEETDIAMWTEFKGDEKCLPYKAWSYKDGNKTIEGPELLLGRAIEKAGGEIAGKLVERFR